VSLETENVSISSRIARYLNNTVWMMAERILRILAALVVGIWVARYLGPEDFGTLSYVIALTAFFSSLARLGLDGVAVREFVNHPQHNDKYIGTVFWLKALGGAAAFCALVGPLFLVTGVTENSILIALASAGFFLQSFEVVDFYFQSKVQAKFASMCKLLQLAGSSILKVLLIINQADLLYFVGIIFLDAVSLAAAYFIAFKIKSKYPLFSVFDKKIAKNLLRDSWPLMLSATVVMVYMRIDQVMIQHLLGSRELGLYSAAVKISEVIYFIPVIVTASVFPAIVNAKKISRAFYMARLQYLYTFMAWLAILLSLPIALLSHHLIFWLFGESFVGAASALAIHVWSSIFVFIGVVFSKYLIAENLPVIALKRTIVGALANIVFNLWLIPIYGITGAAIATLIAQIIANFGYDIADTTLRGQLRMKIIAILCPWTLLVGVK
jgi:O-antigen/teichoic acid export membrane protein